MKNFLQQVVQPGVDPLVSLKVLKFLGEMIAELEKKHGVNSETDAAETFLLKGPQLRFEESKMATIKVTANPDGSASLQLPFGK